MQAKRSSMCSVSPFQLQTTTTTLFSKVYASWVEHTNLLLVIIKQGARSSCYDETNCPLLTPRALPFGFVRLTPAEQKAREAQRAVQNAGDDNEEEGPLSQCPSTAPRSRKNIVQCLRDQSLVSISWVNEHDGFRTTKVNFHAPLQCRPMEGHSCWQYWWLHSFGTSLVDETTPTLNIFVKSIPL